MSKKGQRGFLHRVRVPALDAKTKVAKENVRVKEEAIVFLFPYPGMGTAVAMKGSMPNRWWRMWHWILLGWTWRAK